MRIAILCLVSSALLASAAVAGDNNQPKKAVDPSMKVICKTEEVVGSRIPKRICLTRQQWDQIRENSKDVLEKRQMWQPEKTVSG